MKFWTNAESLKFEVEGMYPKLKITYMVILSSCSLPTETNSEPIY